MRDLRSISAPPSAGQAYGIVAHDGWSRPPLRDRPDCHANRRRSGLNGGVQVNKDGRGWRVGTAADVSWIAGHTAAGVSITTAVPSVFDAYATTYQTDDVTTAAYEQALIEDLTTHTPDQPWWLAYLDTGAHDVVFPHAPRVFLYWNWPYVLVQAGPEQALTWRTGGHIRHPHGALPDLFFPTDRSWLVSALWDDTWTCVGGPAPLIHTLERDPVANARQVRLDEDALPPGLVRE